ncbi:Oidioi.mRNA.OKI2018_I69.chr1.g3804.t1.cds [Oikopleura dioica]|uniref:ribonuclease H n=1 Tax=Oikopleura dioica TaxID=34765 RepID=A0ABN7T241_OIKDI|nr:Oidioi.mRNA.OKI2018_I69.chr1.g3804.t1.cds [Oikopleura dioica]
MEVGGLTIMTLKAAETIPLNEEKPIQVLFSVRDHTEEAMDVKVITRPRELKTGLQITIDNPNGCIPLKPLAMVTTISDDAHVHQPVSNIIPDEEIEALLEKAEAASDESKEFLRSFLREFSDTFSCHENDIGEYKGEPVRLKLIPGAEAKKAWCRPRRVPYEQVPWLRGELKSLEDRRIIQKSSGSPYNSPITLVRKKNGKWRMVIDLRLVNTLIQDSKWPIPSLLGTLEGFSGAKVFSVLDFRAAFHHLLLHSDSRPLTAFSCLGAQWEYSRLPMGLKTSPSVFSKAIWETIPDRIRQYTSVYMDDCAISTPDEKSHRWVLRELFEAFREKGWKLTPGKCLFFVRKIEFLGFEVGDEGWSAKANSKEAIERFPTPKDKRSLKAFIGTCSFLSQLIPDLQRTMGPLHAVSGKKSVFRWESEQEEAFQAVKSAIASSVPLAFPDHSPKTRLILSTDASLVGWGGMLSQKSAAGIETPIGFCSGTFRNSQTRWSTYDKDQGFKLGRIDKDRLG